MDEQGSVYVIPAVMWRGKLIPLEEVNRRRKIAKKWGGIHYPKVACPHCGVEGGGNVMKYRHFDRCPHKPQDDTNE